VLHEPEEISVDDDLAKGFGLETLDELRQRIIDQLRREFGQIARARFKRQLLDKLAEGHDFAVPASMVEQEFNQIWQQVEHAREHGHLDAEDAAKSEDALREDYRIIAERRVRLGLLLSEVGTRNELTVSSEEMNRAIMEEARRYPGQQQQVIDFYRNNAQARAAVQAPIFEDKVVDFIVAMAQVSERAVSSEELIREARETTEAKGSLGAAHDRDHDHDHGHDHDHDHHHHHDHEHGH
jgi:trigger factor